MSETSTPLGPVIVVLSDGYALLIANANDMATTRKALRMGLFDNAQIISSDGRAFEVVDVAICTRYKWWQRNFWYGMVKVKLVCRPMAYMDIEAFKSIIWMNKRHMLGKTAMTKKKYDAISDVRSMFELVKKYQSN